MGILLDILLWIHLMALVGGGASSVAMPAIGRQLAGATPEARERLFGVMKRLTMAARGAVVALIITGPLMFWLKWDFTAPSMMWFGIKMLFVVILVVLMVVNGGAAKAAREGNASSVSRARMTGQLLGISFVIIVLAAVFAFN